MMKPCRAVSIAVAIVAFSFLPAAAADAMPPVAVQMSADGTLVVVADPAHDAVSFYRVAGSQVSLLARQELAEATASDAEKATPPTAAPPTADVPGDDPPGFPRPKRSVRVGTTYSRDSAVQETWETVYWLPGPLEAVYSGLRGALKDWKVLEASISARGSFPRGNLHVVDGPTELRIDVLRCNELPDWVAIQVHETRKRG